MGLCQAVCPPFPGGNRQGTEMVAASQSQRGIPLGVMARVAQGRQGTPALSLAFGKAHTKMCMCVYIYIFYIYIYIYIYKMGRAAEQGQEG